MFLPVGPHTPAPDRPAAALAALVRARTRLIELHAGLGETLTRIDFAEPDERCAIIPATATCEEFTSVSVTIAAGTLRYNPDYLLSMTDNEVLFVVAAMAHMVSERSQDWVAGVPDRCSKTCALTVNAVANAAILHLGIGRLPQTAFLCPVVTHEMSFEDAYPHVRSWEEENETADAVGFSEFDLTRIRTELADAARTHHL